MLGQKAISVVRWSRAGVYGHCGRCVESGALIVYRLLERSVLL